MKILRKPIDNGGNDEYCSFCGDDTVFIIIDGDKQHNGYSCSQVNFCQYCFALFKEELKAADYEKKENPILSKDLINIKVTKSDLISMCMGKNPSYDSMNHIKITDKGTYTGGFYDRWSWSYEELSKCSEQELYEIYIICKG